MTVLLNIEPSFVPKFLEVTATAILHKARANQPVEQSHVNDESRRCTEDFATEFKQKTLSPRQCYRSAIGVAIEGYLFSNIDRLSEMFDD